MYEYIDDLGYGNPDKFICTDPACNGECGADNHPGELEPDATYSFS